MKRFASFLPGALVLMTASPGVAAENRSPGDEEVRQLIRDGVEKQHRAPGIVVGLTDTNGPRVLSHGRVGRDATNAVGADTVFEIGSTTKAFTALLLAIMAERGDVKPDEAAAGLLPKSVKLPSRGGREITLRHLATHTSALPRLPGNFKPADPDNPYADYTVAQMYAFLPNCELRRDIGEKYEYSNLGAGLLGHLLALKAGTNYEALVLREICGPLKLTDTGITLTPGMKARLARGHNAAGVPVKNWDLPTLAGAGALRSTADDMLKFLAANLGLVRSPLSNAMEQTHAAQHEAGTAGNEIALGWHVRKKPDSTFVWHNGGTGGYHSFAGFDTSRRRGVVVLANSANDIDDIGWHLLDARFEVRVPRIRQAAGIDHRVYADYAGRYQLPSGSVFVITRDGDRLLAKLAEQPTLEIHPESETKFFYTVVDAQLTFVRDQAGAVTHLVLHQNGLDQKATRVR